MYDEVNERKESRHQMGFSACACVLVYWQVTLVILRQELGKESKYINILHSHTRT
jgi:hypothetical protein